MPSGARRGQGRFAPRLARRTRRWSAGRRPVRRRQRAAREPAHRQPAARPLGPPGRPRRLEILCFARRRSDADLRVRADGFDAAAPGLKEGEAIIHPWVNKALAKAQQKVEARNYDMRKQLLKYDDVMNDQRKVVYEQRREIMNARDVASTVADMRYETIDEIVAARDPGELAGRAMGHRRAARRVPAPSRARSAARRVDQRGRDRAVTRSRSASPPRPTARWPRNRPITAPT